MKQSIFRFFLWCAALSLIVSPLLRGDPPANPFPSFVRILTANIKIDEPDDGPNRWPWRKALVAQVLLSHHPDIIGLQESTQSQTAYLVTQLVGYRHAPLANSDSTNPFQRLTEALTTWNQIFYRADRFTLLESAHGALRPDNPQDNPTENTFYSLAILRPRDTGLPVIIVLDTHLRHQLPNALDSAHALDRIINAKLHEYPGAWVVLMGDMNHGRADRPLYDALLSHSSGKSAGGLRDTFDYSKIGPTDVWGTFHNFTGQADYRWPTDLIFVGGACKASEARIIRDHSADGRYPSDHFFVQTDIAPIGKEFH